MIVDVEAGLVKAYGAAAGPVIHAALRKRVDTALEPLAAEVDRGLAALEERIAFLEVVTAAEQAELDAKVEKRFGGAR